MSQSNIIAFVIFAMFVVYITAKGELPLYLGFLGISGSSGAAAATPTTSSGSGMPNPGNLGQSIFSTQAPLLAGAGNVISSLFG